MTDKTDVSEKFFDFLSTISTGTKKSLVAYELKFVKIYPELKFILKPKRKNILNVGKLNLM